jgi:hypothetical protein
MGVACATGENVTGSDVIYGSDNLQYSSWEHNEGTQVYISDLRAKNGVCISVEVVQNFSLISKSNNTNNF